MNEEKNYILAESDYVAGMKYKDIAAKYAESCIMDFNFCDRL